MRSESHGQDMQMFGLNDVLDHWLKQTLSIVMNMCWGGSRIMS